MPKAKAKIDCASWCGFGCTRAARERAEREVVRLCKQLGDGWEPRVWENMGWHFQARRGKCSVSPNKHGSAISGTYSIEGYTAIFNTVPAVVGGGATPQGALAAALQQATANLLAFGEDLAEVVGHE